MINTACAIALGFFDGVHIAHKKIIQSAVDYAKQNNLTPIALTFDTAPGEILCPGTIRYLTQNSEKALLIKSLGANTEFLKTDKTLLDMSAEDFIHEILLKKYNIKYAVCGYNYRFGKGGVGDVELLKSYGEKYGFKTQIVAPIECGGESISSSRIRRLILGGNVKEANLLLGRNFSLKGKVTEGKHLGRKIGFPTANIFYDNSCVMLKNGVYKTVANIGPASYKAISNIGINPTVGGEIPRSETYIPSFSENLYGREIEIEFIDFIRPETKFESIEMLKNQIQKDIQEIL